MFGTLVVLLNLAAVIAYGVAVHAWLACYRNRVGGPETSLSDADQLAKQSRLLGRGAIWTAAAVAAEGASLILVLIAAMLG